MPPTSATPASRDIATALDPESARAVADGYLIDQVGDLLRAGTVRLAGNRWEISIVLSNARRGILGEVGTLTVDASTGAVVLSDDERAKLKARARLLAEAAAHPTGS